MISSMGSVLSEESLWKLQMSFLFFHVDQHFLAMVLKILLSVFLLCVIFSNFKKHPILSLQVNWLLISSLWSGLSALESEMGCRWEKRHMEYILTGMFSPENPCLLDSFEMVLPGLKRLNPMSFFPKHVCKFHFSSDAHSPTQSVLLLSDHVRLLYSTCPEWPIGSDLWSNSK